MIFLLYDVSVSWNEQVSSFEVVKVIHGQDFNISKEFLLLFVSLYNQLVLKKKMTPWES